MEESDENFIKLIEFCDITGELSDNGKFFLEAAKWNTELALQNFFDLKNTDTSENNIGNLTKMDDEQRLDNNSNDASSNNETRSGRVLATLSESSSNSQNRHEDSVRSTNRIDNDDDAPAYYAGGSVSSGQQILGRPLTNLANRIMDMFYATKSSSSSDGETYADANDVSFYGQGYRLGQDGEDSEPVEGTASNNSQPNLIDMVIKVWHNGFTVDDGPLRSTENPRDNEFLQLLSNGLVPPEIAHTNPSAIRLKIEDHRFETYAKKEKQVPFTGKGYKLGSTSENNSTLPSSQTVYQDTKEKEDNNPSMPIDGNLPVTTVQLRLTDGRRLKVKLNHNHTIGDLRNYITGLDPQYSSGNFRLITSFPSQELNDNNATIEQAGILNASILLRVK